MIYSAILLATQNNKHIDYERLHAKLCSLTQDTHTNIHKTAMDLALRGERIIDFIKNPSLVPCNDEVYDPDCKNTVLLTAKQLDDLYNVMTILVSQITEIHLCLQKMNGCHGLDYALLLDKYFALAQNPISSKLTR